MDKFILWSKLKELCENSAEYKITQAKDLISSRGIKNFTVIATHENHAIVYKEDSNELVKINFEDFIQEEIVEGVYDSASSCLLETCKEIVDMPKDTQSEAMVEAIRWINLTVEPVCSHIEPQTTQDTVK